MKKVQNFFSRISQKNPLHFYWTNNKQYSLKPNLKRAKFSENISQYFSAKMQIMEIIPTKTKFFYRTQKSSHLLETKSSLKSSMRWREFILAAVFQDNIRVVSFLRERFQPKQISWSYCSIMSLKSWRWFLFWLFLGFGNGTDAKSRAFSDKIRNFFLKTQEEAGIAFKVDFSKTERAYFLILEKMCLFIKPSLSSANFIATIYWIYFLHFI